MLRRALVLLVALAAAGASAEELRQPQKLTVSLADDFLGQLDPDGKRLYFVSNRDATSQIYAQDQKAPASALLFDEDADVTWPRVSPDGRRLAYVSFADDASGQLCVRGLPKLDRRCLPGGGALEAAWSGSDELVLLSRGSPESDLTLSRVRLDGRTLSAQPLLSRNLNGPTISPDRRWLVFVPLTRAGTRIGPAFAASAARALVFHRLDNGAETTVQLELPGGTSQPAFSADGRWLYFTQFLNDTDQNGVLDGDDHGVVFRVAFDGHPETLAQAVPEQLTSAAWNCQYPAPSPQKLVLTCAARTGGLDLYTLPLDGMAPDGWSLDRLRDQIDATRDRWERLMLLHRLARITPSSSERAALLAETLRQHLLAGEYEAALFHTRALGKSAVPSLAAMSKGLEWSLAERRAMRAFDRGEMGHRYLVEAKARVVDVTAWAPTEPAAVATRHLVLCELYDHLGDKSAAIEELERVTIDDQSPALLVQLFAARAENLDRELDRHDELLATLRGLVDHPALPEAEKLRLGGIFARALLRPLSTTAGRAAAATERTSAPAGSARAFALALWPCIADVTAETEAAGKACVDALYTAEKSLARRRVLVSEVVDQADDTSADELEYALVRRWIRDVPRDSAERTVAQKLVRHVIIDRAYEQLLSGHPAEAAAQFEAVLKHVLSLEAHIGFIEASLAAGRDPAAVYAERYKPDAPEARFARAYLSLRRLPELEGPAFERAWQAADDEVEAVEADLSQKCEVQALHGSLLHLRYLHVGDRGLAEQANTRYLLALDLAHENGRYRSMVLEQLALLHLAVGNFRIALGHFEEREKLPFSDPRIALGHALGRARALYHIGRAADAVKAIAAALTLVDQGGALAAYRPLALDRAALYALAADDPKRALGWYDDAERARDPNEGARNPMVRSLARAAAALGAGQPDRALADLDRFDRAFDAPDGFRPLAWSDVSVDEVRANYDLLRLGLRGQAERALGRLDDAKKTLTVRLERLEARAKSRGYDEDLRALSAAEAQLAQLEKKRGDPNDAATLAHKALMHADEYARKTKTPLADAQLAAIGFAAELNVIGGVPAEAFGFDVRARLQDAYARLARKRDPALRETRVRFGVYLTLSALDRLK